MRRELVAIAAALPVLAIALAIARAELQGRRANEFEFAISGFDPRDMLKGHYLQFRLNVTEGAPRETCTGTEPASCCLCITRGEQPHERAAVVRATCSTARAQCDGALSIRYLQQPLRYYVPEANAATLTTALADAMRIDTATAIIAIDTPDNLQVRALLSNGVPLEDTAPPPR